ncbi:MAG: DUF1998 domain-containing protein, partial [Candidatus Lindowbacteria bacterium]|nr:DUF1998 domain-containing protein [Candidatus Lindowbacteria bacterium]
EHCHTPLDANSEFLTNLFEMTAVATQRTESITCDEEERVRQGYEITTHFKLARKDGRRQMIPANVKDAQGGSLLTIAYGPAANLWRINRRWRRSRTHGYNLDLTHGIWTRRLGDPNDTALDSGQENVRAGVQVFVKDTRNILLIRQTIENPLSEEQLANLQHALQSGICAVFQIDDDEISSERIGQGNHRSVLYWEAAEGGAGVLQRFVEEPDALSRVAKEALEICHFDADTGNENDPETECACACYECLLTYYNQRDHALLNRHVIKDLLMKISQGSTQKGYETRSYEEQYHWLRGQTDARSQLEKEFLDFLYRGGKRLPDAAQKLVENYPSRPDFYYDDGCVCVFCDGSVHDDARQREEDKRARSALQNRGYRVIVIRYDRALNEQIQEYGDVFGVVK